MDEKANTDALIMNIGLTQLTKLHNANKHGGRKRKPYAGTHISLVNNDLQLKWEAVQWRNICCATQILRISCTTFYTIFPSKILQCETSIWIF